MGFFDIFRKSVKKTKQNLSLELDNFSGKITADTLEELEEILILDDGGKDLLQAGRTDQAPEH